MRRPAWAPKQAPVCLICDALTVRGPSRAKATFTTRSVSNARPALDRRPRCSSIQPVAVANTSRPRWLASRINSRTSAEGKQDGGQAAVKPPPVPEAAGREITSLTNMLAYIDNNKAKVLNHRGVPSEADISAALQACQIVADYIMDDSVQPQISHMISETDSAASNLLSLDPSGRKKTTSRPATFEEAGTSPRNTLVSNQLMQMIDRISEAAYVTLAHPTVLITPSLLEQYVKVQATLGRPETLPRVFQLYASKPRPQEVSGSIKYSKQNPNQASKAIDTDVADMALDTAIEAKNLDAAVGIIENTYTTTAFIRSKVLRKSTLPLATFAATPLAAYAVARNFSIFQDAMDTAQATNVAFAGILAYVGFTATIGVVAATTANDQMKRVTWAPGVPLRSRWVREEERAALDRIACAWGFAEPWRQGEEEGPEWDVLREYIGQKGMVLDRTELMEGME
ncbi:hypothetical protein PFICI_01184 [Pestalotiopsis fici W106-1]|uniref:Uncharacterized protein n=1 Tax=Pestalotiopsis fici (strain W106-1 / CGMCC3.15140) TaxID=1229662 RepID=W3XQ36_PESFW|nr:uncharacterized protein PFICI_01184 [Pestalotiopsis fici W106-1]ETS87356.1 hypothetical protein PFICI_01184 [Pestalotiopsis fici W106-1]